MIPLKPRILHRVAAYRPLLEMLADVLLTSDELCGHWRYTPTHLCNIRKHGKVPYIKLASGGIRYRVSEIIAAEIEGTSGPITVEQICLALAACEGLSTKDREIAQAHVRKSFALEVPARRRLVFW